MQRTIHNFIGYFLFLLLSLTAIEVNAQVITMSFPQSTTYINSIPVRWSISPTSQTLNEISITFTGTAGAAVGVTTTLSIKPANIAATGLFTLNPLDLNNAANIYTVTAGTSIPDGSYTVRMRYVRSDLVVIQSSTASINLDATTLPPVMTSPVASTIYGGLLNINYQLPETPRLSGFPVQLTFVGAVNTTPVVLNMSSSLNVNFDLDATNVASNSVYVRGIASGGSTLPDDTYTVVLSYVDNFSHSAASASVSNVVIDTITPTINVVTAVPTIGNDANPSFTFNSDEAGTITTGGGCSTAATTATSGDNTITLASNSSGAALSEGTYSSCTVRVTDPAGNQSSILNIPAFTIDLTSPVVTLNGNAFIGAVVGDNYVDAGATANDSQDGNLTSSLSSIVAGSTSTVGSSFTVTWSVSDSAGNSGSAVRTILNLAATATPIPTATTTVIPSPTNTATPTATAIATPTSISAPTASPTAIASPSNPGEISGFIFNSNGEPVIGVVVYLYAVEQSSQVNGTSAAGELGKLSTITDQDGKYSFQNLPRGDYLVKPNLTDITFEPATSVSTSGGTPPSFLAVQRAVKEEGCSKQDQRQTILTADFRAKRLTNFAYNLTQRFRIVAIHTLDGAERKKFEALMNKRGATIAKLYTSVLQASESLPKIQRECSANASCSLVNLDAAVKSYNKYLSKISANALLVLDQSEETLPKLSKQQLREYKKYNQLLLRRVTKYSSKLPNRTYQCQS